ncbi:MAG: phosphatase [Acidovorax sp. SCN 68-22]|uniref:PhoX family protein n=1 Tax=Acidovorax sp. NO-1 TaxID=512030 RepID=UPI00023FC541|nr:PhoX family phosphatase [Acidovorax sp. NO-1]EHL22893.1 twin-arginine translocation pathway signal protein [Acidovorax sp. NO-1]ODS69367.1 MAG: phosphatase [Acidovorax sp. SCN 68-22]
MKKLSDTATIDFNDENSNTSSNPTFDSVLAARLSRRGLLRGSVGTMGTALLGSFAVAACGGGDDEVVAAPGETLLGFNAVSKSLADAVIVPAGYTASVIYALGDPLKATTPAFKNDGTDADYENRAGDHHDGMEWFGLSGDGKLSASSTDRGLLAVNHEATTDEKLSSFFMHANGGTTTLPRPASEIDKEVAAHGISVVEVKKTSGKWATVQSSAFNFRLTALSDIEIAGPARGNALMVTKFSPTGTRTRGTLNNCGTGKTPWGTFLTGEENWFGYFTRGAADDAARGNDKSVTSLKRYGRNQGAASRHGWESGGTEDKYARWINSKLGASADGSDDYRNEMNGMGYIVEIDVLDKSRPAKKRTFLGRFAHESAAFGTPVVGQPLVVYMGDDARNEYVYKYVSTALWSAADANPADRMATGDKYLDNGKLYVAKYNADGSGQWIELSLANPLIANYAGYKFADQADIVVNARIAGDAVGATKMDRPEWGGVNPANGEIYQTLTNNSNRRVEPSGSTQLAPDASNPRVYTDMKGSTAQPGNPNGHLLRMKEGSAGGAATTFTWDIYLFGAEAGADKGVVNISSLTADQDFSSPDGLVFSPSTGICWIQTDDGAYTDVTNNMMLAAIPGRVGDGGKKTLSFTKADGSKLDVVTAVGKAPTPSTLKRFLVGPVGCEITGLCETPDGKTMFINIQHPGENTLHANIGDPAKYTSQWPTNAGYGPGKRPRSATIVITKNDGGRIGS